VAPVAEGWAPPTRCSGYAGPVERCRRPLPPGTRCGRHSCPTAHLDTARLDPCRASLRGTTDSARNRRCSRRGRARSPPVPGRRIRAMPHRQTSTPPLPTPRPFASCLGILLSQGLRANGAIAPFLAASAGYGFRRAGSARTRRNRGVHFECPPGHLGVRPVERFGLILVGFHQRLDVGVAQIEHPHLSEGVLHLDAP
jgi:hypothetical protein